MQGGPYSTGLYKDHAPLFVEIVKSFMHLRLLRSHRPEPPEGPHHPVSRVTQDPSLGPSRP